MKERKGEGEREWDVNNGYGDREMDPNRAFRQILAHCFMRGTSLRNALRNERNVLCGRWRKYG